MSTHSSSPARVLANQANALRSTGPISAAGKAASSYNALSTGLTGRTVLLAYEDRAVYERHLQAFRKHYAPANEVELCLVQSLADTEWRLNRIPQLIFGLEAKGHDEAIRDESTRTREYTALDGYLKYEKEIRNLALQESRLHRRQEKDLAALRAMQTEREERRQAELAEAAKLYLAAKEAGQSFQPADSGFEFSTVEIESHLAKLRAESLLKRHLTSTASAAV